MKTTTLCLVISLAVSVLFIAILLQGPTKKTKEGFAMNVEEVGIGVAIGIGVCLVVFAGFFFFFYSVPKKVNVIPMRGPFLNNQY
jgi:hypothetical protein